ncbi:MAG: N-acetylmuramoyl-L-alanine amidase [Alphaproteobacteria bacterium GM7ARS4]|nr:N-acetylmuramoyl-L-alanine amidase [Alphaproteobacteria bacterium GM7ARS4]
MAVTAVVLLLLGATCLYADTSRLQVKAIRFSPASTETMRVVLDIAGKHVDYHAFMLDEPVRIVIDIDHGAFSLPQTETPRAHGFITDYRYGRFTETVSRLVLLMDSYVVISRVFTLPVDDDHPLLRLVIDLEAVENKAAFDKKRQERRFASATALLSLLRPPPPQSQEPMTPPLPKRQDAAPPHEQEHEQDGDKRPPTTRAPATPPIAPPVALKPREKPLIVIDAGHGGIDTGAISVHGMAEKDVNLRMAFLLRRYLLATGKVRVFMTREKDVFVSLSQRVIKARKQQASLFLSIHADSHPKPYVRGFSVYTLSETASDKEAEALAQRENKSDIIAGVDFRKERPEVFDILIDLTQRATNDNAHRLALCVVDRMRVVSSSLPNPKRSAGFAVLKAPDIPSILIELGYLSNTEDEKRLRKTGYLAALARAITDAVTRHIGDTCPSTQKNL